MKPYVSFVVAARNDNYGGNFLHRFQVFLDALVKLWAKHSLQAELVVVEWNPPTDRPRLSEVVSAPNLSETSQIRFVEVPAAIHKRLPNGDRMPMFEYLAKNVGIRRASGEHILVTNPDIIFSDEMIQLLAARQLKPDCFYRVDRYDVGKQVPLGLSIQKTLRFCAKHAFRANPIQGGTIPVGRFARRQLIKRNLSRLLTHKAIRGLLRRCRKGNMAPPTVEVRPDARLGLLHVNAPGDFLLMASSKWHELRAFPELPTHSHIDSYMVYIAAAAGLKQVVLPCRIYHQEHDRSEQVQRPATVLQDIPAVRKMFETGTLDITNSPEWGLGSFELAADALIVASLTSERARNYPNSYVATEVVR